MDSPSARLLAERAGLMRLLKATASPTKRQSASRRVAEIDRELKRG